MALERYGWNDRFNSLFGTFRDRNLIPARIIRVDRGGVTAQTGYGAVAAVIAGSLDPAGVAAHAAL